MVERILGKDEVTSSNLVSSFIFLPEVFGFQVFFIEYSDSYCPDMEDI